MQTIEQYVKVQIELMQQQGKIRECNIESAALQFISMNFGFVILDVSFGKSLMGITKEEYIQNSIELFASGISSWHYLSCLYYAGTKKNA